MKLISETREPMGQFITIKSNGTRTERPNGELIESVFECPCGKGRLISTFENNPGYLERYARFNCDDCDKMYSLSLGGVNPGMPPIVKLKEYPFTVIRYDDDKYNPPPLKRFTEDEKNEFRMRMHERARNRTIEFYSMDEDDCNDKDTPIYVACSFSRCAYVFSQKSKLWSEFPYYIDLERGGSGSNYYPGYHRITHCQAKTVYKENEPDFGLLDIAFCKQLSVLLVDGVGSLKLYEKLLDDIDNINKVLGEIE